MMKFYVTFEEALKEITEVEVSPSPEVVPVSKSLNRVLAEDIVADFDDPPVDLSAMDGYALRFSDIGKVPVRLKVVGEVKAGDFRSVSIGKGEAVRIFTGSPVPKGTDTVVPVEYTREEGGFVVVERIFPPGSNIRRRGENFKRGEILLRKGRVIKPAHMGLLSLSNRVSVRVFRKPRVGIIVTGNEIVEPGASPDLRIRNANGYSLIGLVEESGAEPVYFGVVGDDRRKIRRAVEDALSVCDVVITSGGVSMGNYDFVEDVIEDIGARVIFYKVRVKPGKPVLFAAVKGKFILSLPGFPVSTVVGFYNFAFPLIRRILGADEVFKRRVRGILRRDYSRRKAERTEFLRCRYSFDMERGVYIAEPVEKQGSGSISAMAEDVALMVVPSGVKSLKSGEPVELILISA